VSPALCDTNVWLALTIGSHEHHLVAQSWLDGVRDRASILFCRSTQQSYLRLITNASAMAQYGLPPFSNEQAWESYETAVEDDRIVFQTDEPDEIERYWKQYSSRATASTKMWMDAYLAAFARTGGYRFVTTDAAFRQYAGLDLHLLTADA